jgi:hypothetical protein
MTTKNTRAANAIFGETVKPIPTMTVLLIRLPTTGISPHRNVMPTTTTGCGRPTARTKMVVKTVLMAEMTI